MGSVRRQVLGVAGAVLAFTAIALASPSVRFEYPLPGLAMFVAAVASLSCVALAAMFLARHQRTGLRSDLLVAVAFGVTALLELVLAILPEIDGDHAGLAFWARTLGRNFVAIILCAAAWVRGTRAAPARTRSFLAGCVAGGLVLVTYTTLMQQHFPPVIRGAQDATAGAADFDPVSLGFRLGTTTLFALAAIGFTVRALKDDEDTLARWLATGTILLGAARLHALFHPSLNSDWLTTVDILRTLGQVALLLGVSLDLLHAHRQRVEAAAADERRRVARDLHDGLAQELAWLTTQSDLIASGRAGRDELEGLARSAERALSETRLAILELADQDDVRLDVLLGELARQTATRYGRQVHLDLQPVDLDQHRSKELARIAREGLTNAVRHSGAARLTLRLSATPEMVRVVVQDNGTGLAPSTTPNGGFGLTSMRERAEALGGSCSVLSHPGNGTIVAVEVPF